MELGKFDKLEAIHALGENIPRVIAEKRSQSLAKVVENWVPGLEFIQGSRGDHLHEIIFKTCHVTCQTIIFI